MNKKFGEIIKKARKEKGWSQNRFAEEVKRKFPPRGVSQSTINRIEDPDYQENPTEGTKEKLLLTLGISDGTQIISSNIKMVDYEHQKELELSREQIEFYKEKAEFYEMKYKDLKLRILRGKRADDPEDINVIELRKFSDGSAFPYGFKTE